MRSSISRLIAVLVLIVSACYQSPVPAGGAALPIDASLLGQWEEIEPEASPTVVTITRAGSQYIVDMPLDFPGGATTLHASAHITRVGGAEFINLREIDGADEEYVVLKLTRHADHTLGIATLKQSVPRFASTGELQRYLAQHADDPSIVQDELRLRKVTRR